MSATRLLAELPDDARVRVTLGEGGIRVGELRKALAAPDPHRVLTTGEASKLLGYSPDTWRTWASEVPGSYRDEGERGYWRLPYGGCVEHLRRLQATRTRRGRRGPWKKAREAAQAGTAGPEGHRPWSVVRGGSEAVGRRQTDDAKPSGPRLA
jgi:hypothetical protein